MRLLSKQQHLLLLLHSRRRLSAVRGSANRLHQHQAAQNRRNLKHILLYLMKTLGTTMHSRAWEICSWGIHCLTAAVHLRKFADKTTPRHRHRSSRHDLSHHHHHRGSHHSSHHSSRGSITRQSGPKHSRRPANNHRRQCTERHHSLSHQHSSQRHHNHIRHIMSRCNGNTLHSNGSHNITGYQHQHTYRKVGNRNGSSKHHNRRIIGDHHSSSHPHGRHPHGRQHRSTHHSISGIST
mmetsp:Transcript_29826/g.72624  ORF Transcript_29826/g.72624 Transcript_29826/m.72624 type:complete len:238 (+) Transcript_29826:6-719(+)